MKLIVSNSPVQLGLTENKINIGVSPQRTPSLTVADNNINLNFSSLPDTNLTIDNNIINFNITEEKKQIEIYNTAIGAGGIGNSVEQTYLAGENIGGHRAVIIQNDTVYYASSDDLTHRNRPMGISKNSASTGFNVTVVTFGEFLESSWNWTLGYPVFVGIDGVLVQTLDASSLFACVIALPLTDKKIFVQKLYEITL